MLDWCRSSYIFCRLLLSKQIINFLLLLPQTYIEFCFVLVLTILCMLRLSYSLLCSVNAVNAKLGTIIFTTCSPRIGKYTVSDWYSVSSCFCNFSAMQCNSKQLGLLQTLSLVQVSKLRLLSSKVNYSNVLTAMSYFINFL